MSQADELLESMSEDDIALYTASPETEGHIIIGTDRQIVVPEELKMIAVQYDHNIETVTFDCIRYWDGRDLSKMNLYINLRLPNGTPDQYLIEDLTIDEDDPKIMHFTWTIEGRTTKYKGNLTFLVCAKRVNAEGKEENHWNSFLNSDMYVTEGLECEEAIIESNPAVLTSLLLRMETAEATVAKIPDDINAALEEAKKNGDFDGKSSYEVALDNGFKGSESEWLASLKGDIGDAFTYEDFTEEQLEALRGPQGDPGEKGDIGDAFTYEDFTEEQLADLKGEKGDKGDAFTYEDFTEEQLAALKGEKGDAFEYSDFTEEQLEDLKGPKGDAGDDGCSIHIRTTDGWNTVLSSSGATTTMNADDVSDSDNIAINHIVLDKCYANNYYCTCFWVVTGISDGVLSLSGAGYYYVYTGPKGDKGDPGFSPNVQVEEHTEGTGGYDVVITYLDDSGVEMPVAFRIYHGDKGDKGDTGVSITKVEKITNNTGSGQDNTIRVTLSDDSTHDFTVKNGAKGDPGDSAYQVALNNGFDGSEEAWLESLVGVSITNVEKITSNAGSGASNTIRITLSNGSTHDFTVNNGERGAPGDPGDSAYQVALNNGFDGSEEAWLESLKGDKGDPGNPGSNGTSCTHSWSGTTLTVNSASGSSSANLKGDPGNPGSNGTSCTHSWSGTTLTVTSASGTSSANLKGDTGPEPSDSRLKTLIAAYLNETYFTTGY